MRTADGRISIAGALKAASKPEDASQGVMLETVQTLTALADLLTTPIRACMDTKTGMVYELFDQEAVERAIELQRSENDKQRSR